METKTLWYTNYKVIIDVVLLTEGGTEIDASKVSNFIIYTNAKIEPSFLGQ